MKIKLMPYEGTIHDLVKYGPAKVGKIWIVKFQGEAIALGGNVKKDTIHNSENYAKKALREHIYCNFWNGYYWHKGKENSFDKAGGMMRNGGFVSQNKAEFKIMAAEMTEWLLENKVFTIHEIIL